MTDQFEQYGEWWFPKQPEQHFRGKLTFSPKKRAFLDADSVITGIETEWYQLFGKIIKDVILGILDNGTKITLYSYWFQSYSEIELGFVFTGVHFDKPEKMKFDSISVQFLNLDSWVMGMRTIKRQKSFRISNKLSITISLNKESKIQQTENGVTQKICLLIKPSSHLNFTEFSNIISTFNNFLTFAVTMPTYPTAVEGKIKSAETCAKEICVQIFLWQAPYSFETPAYFPSQRMLFTLNDVFGRKKVLEKWFERKAALKPVYDLYFGTLYHEESISNEFLNLIQALETYHRKTAKTQNVLPKYYQEKIDAIIENSKNAEFKEWLKGKLYHNELSLSKRLEEILNECPPKILTQIGDQRVFIKKVRDTRNYFTHYDKPETIATVEELFQLTPKLRLLLQFCFLKETGFNIKHAERLILRLL